MPTRSRSPRGGFSYLELQISMALFALALAGVGPLVVVQSRHLARIEQRFPPGETHLLSPRPSIWERKLGAAAERTETLSPIVTQDLVIDNGATGYSQIQNGIWDWSDYTSSDYFQSDMRLNACNGEGDTAIWTFNGLQPGRYEVYTTWRPYNFLTNDAHYEIFDGVQLLDTKTENLRTWPNDVTLDGFPWERLRTVDIASQELRLELDDRDTGYIAIDAARLIPVKNELQVQTWSQDPDTHSAQAYIEMKLNVE